jgi:hypothetical protein
MTENNGIFTLREFYNRGVIKLAPDVLVYIGGELNTVVVAPINSNNGNLSFSDGITSVSVQNNVDPPGSSSASIEIATPIYGQNSKYWTTYKASNNHPYGRIKAPMFGPMLEVKIFFKGRFLVDMRPRYYVAFWGFINNIEESYSGGMYKINLGCVDMLHWWAYSSLNVHPVPESNIMAGGAQKLTAWSTIFEKSNPYGILYDMVNGMGMHEFVTAAWVAQKTSLNEIYPQDQFIKHTEGIMSYWQQRFKSIGNLLKMYGMNGKRVDKNGLQTVQPFETETIVKVDKNSETGQATASKNSSIFSTDTNFMKEFMVFADFESMGNFEHAEYTTKLEIATEVKTRCDFEFFQDQNGNFVFKPPFYNVNVKGLIPYTILPSDIINYSFNTDIEGIVTVMAANTVFDALLKRTSFGLGRGFYMDLDLTKRYGVRYKEITLQYITEAKMANSLAVGFMSMVNAKTVNGSVTIPGRPEIRLGYPVYVEHRDSFHYVKSINHSFDYGGSFTTTLALETERRQIPVPDESISVSKTTTNKNKVYRYTATTTPAPDVAKTEVSSVPPAPLPGLGGSDAALNSEISNLEKQIADLAAVISTESILSNTGNRAKYDSLLAKLRDLNSKKSATTVFIQRTGWQTDTVLTPEYYARQKKVQEEAQLSVNQYNTLQGAINTSRLKAMQGTVITTPPPIAASTPQEITKQDLLTSEQKVIANKEGLYQIDDVKKAEEISVTETTVPYSDDEGYKVIGAFPYGRNLNPVLISNEIEEAPLNTQGNNVINLKNIYLATMARPIYRNESVAMEPLFFDNVEGAVPTYIGNSQGEIPDQLGLGTKPDAYFDSLTPIGGAKTPEEVAQPEEPPTAGDVKAVTNAAAPFYTPYKYTPSDRMGTATGTTIGMPRKTLIQKIAEIMAWES